MSRNNTDLLQLSKLLKYYKRIEIQEAIVDSSTNREVGVRYGNGFGKRPDILVYPRDVLEFAKKRATSFHISEERWNNPLNISPELKQNEVEELRKGWDLVIDIDFTIWSVTKQIADAIVKALKQHDIKSISCKFSGNKGFHIGVPFEAFPEKVTVQGETTETKLLFPDSTKRMVEYLVDYVDNKHNDFELSKRIMEDENFINYLQESKKNIHEFTSKICSSCGTLKKTRQAQDLKAEFICRSCGKSVIESADQEYKQCDKCKILMEKKILKIEDKCKNCGSNTFRKKFNLEIDTLLISSRHLYRSVYSLHEKSGLASVPVDPENVLQFEKEQADPEKVTISKFVFLDTRHVSAEEARKLIVSAFDFKPVFIEEEKEKKQYSSFELEEDSDKIPEEIFPPCIVKIFEGLKDGKKRAMFILLNFLKNMNWNYDEIEERMKEWNKKNAKKGEALRDNILLGHLRYHKQKKNKVLPPNCDNSAYFKDMRVCVPDELCARIKNPVNYSKRKARFIKGKKKKTNAKK